MIGGKAKLSKIQRAVLRHLKEHDGFMRASSLLLLVARDFDKNGDKLWDRRQVKKRQMEAIERAKASGNKKEYEELVREGYLLFPLIDACHRKNTLILNRFSASFSRSMKELEKRGLISRYNSVVLCKYKADRDLEEYLKKHQEVVVYMEHEDWKIIGIPTPGKRTNYVKLTESAIEYFSAQNRDSKLF